MLTIPQEKLPASEADVRAALAEYQAAIDEHAQTIGQPAPWPQFELLRDIVAAGGEFTVQPSEALSGVDDVALPAGPTALEKLQMVIDYLAQQPGATEEMKAIASPVTAAIKR